MALTFDDGPSEIIPQVRQILRRYNVRATFFDVGQEAQEFPGQQRALAADGHLLGNHSWDHRYHSQVPWTPGYLRDQLRRTNALLSQNQGGRPVCFFRPPGGGMHNVLAAAQAERMSVALWSVDTLDWKQPKLTTAKATNDIVTRATTNPGPHPIVLMHVNKASREPESKVHGYRGNTLAALPRIIEWYKKRGYAFVDLAGRSGLRRETA